MQQRLARLAHKHARAVARAHSTIHVGRVHGAIARGEARGTVACARSVLARTAARTLKVARCGAANTARAGTAGYVRVSARARKGTAERVGIEIPFHEKNKERRGWMKKEDGRKMGKYKTKQPSSLFFLSFFFPTYRYCKLPRLSNTPGGSSESWFSWRYLFMRRTKRNEGE